MVDTCYRRFELRDRSYFSLTKKEIRKYALEAGMSDMKLANMDIIVAEMISNLDKYGKEGELLCKSYVIQGVEYFEILCVDNGVGIIDPEKMLIDGNSSTNSLGIGLGTIKRLSDFFEIYTKQGWGTILLSRIVIKPSDEINIPLRVTPMVLAMPGQEVSGDGFAYKVERNRIFMLVADGLGHGPLAHHAVDEACKAFRDCDKDMPQDIIRHIHEAIRKTRGIVASVLVYNLETKKWLVSGVGNIATKFSNVLRSKSIICYNGIIGHVLPNTINSQELSGIDYPFVTCCSDGIKSRWDMEKFTNIKRYDPSIQAAAIYKSFGRQTDDMTVVIAKVMG